MRFPETIDDAPAAWLARVGEIFATFDAATQDSGNVAWGVRIGGARHFVKSAGDPADPTPFLNHDARVALLENAAAIADAVAHPALPRRDAVVGSPWGPLLVGEWCDGDLLYAPAARRDHPDSAANRFRRLPPETVAAALDTLFDLHAAVHRAGWIPGDFYDGCLLYDFAARRLRVIDLDAYHRGPTVNAMGRMFGSSRFMAPEEFRRGARIDARTGVFALGRAALLLLGDGTDDPAAFRGGAALHAVARRAADPVRARRFASPAALARAWNAARRERGFGQRVEP